jgi:hypothetical protein
MILSKSMGFTELSGAGGNMEYSDNDDEHEGYWENEGEFATADIDEDNVGGKDA